MHFNDQLESIQARIFLFGHQKRDGLNILESFPDIATLAPSKDIDNEDDDVTSTI